MNKPITTLFMLESLDEKNSGYSDKLHVDKDGCKLHSVKEGLQSDGTIVLLVNLEKVLLLRL